MELFSIDVWLAKADVLISRIWIKMTQLIRVEFCLVAGN
jgi:hypothetical protein